MTSSASGGQKEPRKDADPLLGKVLDGRYRIEAVLGTGGVGVVYRARHMPLDRDVAIKVLHGELGLIEELRKRFDREAQVLSALSHPHIVGINDYGIADNMPYLVMELLEGRTLADLIDDDGPPDPDLALDIARQILRGLAFAHARGVVHRDLKAANVFLVSLPDSPHHVKILDFGLAKIYATEDGDAPLADRTLTKSGTILGTPAYMSPEQASGSKVNERTDVYSAGVVLFELLTGQYPFNATTRADMLRAHMLEPVPKLASVRPGLVVEPELEAIIDTAMSKERATRYPHAQAMLDALDVLPRPAARFDPLAPLRARNELSDSAEDPTVPVSAEEPKPSERPPPTTERIEPLRRYAPVLMGAVVLVVLVLVAILSTGDDDSEEVSVASEPPSTSERAEIMEASERTERIIDDIAAMEAAEAVAEEVTESAAVDGGQVAEDLPTRAELPPAVDPFETVLPEPLRRYHLKVRSGRPLQRSERRALQRLQQQMPGDPRATLILAHHYVDINFLTDAIERYELAYEMDASSRGDGRMMRDLVRLSGNEAVADRAAALIERVYGVEAVPEIERQIATTMDPPAIDRLMLLRNRLQGG